MNKISLISSSWSIYLSLSLNYSTNDPINPAFLIYKMDLFHACSWGNCFEIASNRCPCTDEPIYLCSHHLWNHKSSYPDIPHESISIITWSDRDTQALTIGLEMRKQESISQLKEIIKRMKTRKDKLLAKLKSLDEEYIKLTENLINSIQETEKLKGKLSASGCLPSDSDNFLVSEILNAKLENQLDEITANKIIELNAYHMRNELLRPQKIIQMNDQDLARALQTNDSYFKNSCLVSQSPLGHIPLAGLRKIISMAISPYDQLFVIGFSSGILALFSLVNCKILDSTEPIYNKRSNLVFSHNGDFIAFGHLNVLLAIGYIKNDKFECFKTINIKQNQIAHLDISPFSNDVIASDCSSDASIIDTYNSDRKMILKNEEKELASSYYFFQAEKKRKEK